MNGYPMKLSPVYRDILWGGDRLKREYNKETDLARLAESWELTVRPDGVNKILNGSLAGTSLDDCIRSDRAGILGSVGANGERFPLLIKFIDARDDLSIQAHPDDDYALKNENEFGKTEMWYIAEAEEGARIVYGLKDGLSISEFAEMVKSGRAEAALNYINVKKGDVYFIPSGQVHAIGRGILIAEIQQNSNVTYRVYDYGRRQTDGSLRPLHIKKALDVLRLRAPEEIHALQFARKNSDDPALLCSCEYFNVWRHEVVGEKTISVSGESFFFLLVLNADENAAVFHAGKSYALKKGDGWFLPAGLGETTICGKAEILFVSAN